MTSSMTSQGCLKVGPLYSFINEIITFFMITKQRAKISSLNFLCICSIRLWLQLYEYIFMTSLMTSPCQKIGQILKLIYLRQYLNYSVDQKLKMSEMLMAIFLVYSTCGIGSGSKLQGQCLVNKCQYRNCLSRLYMPKDDLNELHFSRLQVKGQHHRLTAWPWH